MGLATTKEHLELAKALHSPLSGHGFPAGNHFGKAAFIDFQNLYGADYLPSARVGRIGFVYQLLCSLTSDLDS